MHPAAPAPAPDPAAPGPVSGEGLAEAEPEGNRTHTHVTPTAARNGSTDLFHNSEFRFGELGVFFRNVWARCCPAIRGGTELQNR